VTWITDLPPAICNLTAKDFSEAYKQQANQEAILFTQQEIVASYV
jgi:hypothetical protein